MLYYITLYNKLCARHWKHDRIYARRGLDPSLYRLKFKCNLEKYFIYELRNRVFSIPVMCLITKLSLSSIFLRIVYWRFATSELVESHKLLLLSLYSPDAAGQWAVAYYFYY